MEVLTARELLSGSLPEIVSIYVPLRLVDISKDIFSCCTNNKQEPLVVTPNGLPGEAV